MAEDRGRQSVPDEMLEGQQNLEGFGGFAGANVNEDPAVVDVVEEDRGKLFAALMIVGPAALAIPKEGNAGTLVSGSGNEILEWPDIETTGPNTEPARRVILPTEPVTTVAVTPDDKILATTSDDGVGTLYVIEASGETGELEVTRSVELPNFVIWDIEPTPDDQVVIGGGGWLGRVDLSNPEGSFEMFQSTEGQAAFTSTESFTDGEGKVNVLAIGQTSGGTNADVLYRICEDDDLVEPITLPWGTAGKLSVSESKIVLVTNEGVVSMDFDKSNPESLPEAIANYSVLVGGQEAFDGGGIDTVDHNDFGFYMVGMGDGTARVISKDGGARSDLPITYIYNLDQIGESSRYIGVSAGGMTVVDGQSQEVVGTFEGVGGSVNAVIPSSAEIDALLAAPVYNEVHVLADPAYTVTESEEPDTVEVALDVEALIASGDPAAFSFFTTPSAPFQHTVIVDFGSDDIPLTGYGTACEVRTFVEDGSVKLTAEVLKDGRTGNSSVSLDGGERIYEHPDMDPETPAGENNAQTIELGRVEDFVTQSDDDDDTVESVDDDDAAVETPGGCGSCEYSNNGSDAVAGLSLIVALAFTAMRKRVRRGVFGK